MHGPFSFALEDRHLSSLGIDNFGVYVDKTPSEAGMDKSVREVRWLA